MDAPVSAKAALLQALVRGPGYGLDLSECVREATRGELELSGGSVYPALRALERDGFVESAGEEPCGDRGGRPRQLYRITERGLAEAERQRQVMAALMAMADGRRGRCGTAVEAIPQAELGREAEVTVEQRWVVRDEEGP